MCRLYTPAGYTVFNVSILNVSTYVIPPTLLEALSEALSKALSEALLEAYRRVVVSYLETSGFLQYQS